MRLKREITFTPDEVRQALYEWLSNGDHYPESADEMEISFIRGNESLTIPDDDTLTTSVRVQWVEER